MKSKIIHANLRMNLRDARLAATGIGQQKVAKALGIKVETLRDYEKGRAVPPDDILEKMLKLYNLPESLQKYLIL